MGLTPLHQAVRYGNDEIAKILLEHGASLDLKDKEGKSPFDMAKE